MNSFLVDIGNSTAVIGVLDNGKYRMLMRVETPRFLALFKQLCSQMHVTQSIISSVVPLVDAALSEAAPYVNAAGNPVNFRFVTAESLPMPIHLDAVGEVGADRLVNAFAASRVYRAPCLVIDLGTALTFCYVSAEGAYEGGAIFPGMRIASRALNDYTAKIPLIYVSRPNAIIGKTTESAVQVGLYYGFIQLINGMIRQYRDLEPDVFVVGTGDGLTVILDELDLDVYDGELVLKGLALLAQA